jgi:hypothetical protein
MIWLPSEEKKDVHFVLRELSWILIEMGNSIRECAWQWISACCCFLLQPMRHQDADEVFVAGLKCVLRSSSSSLYATTRVLNGPINNWALSLLYMHMCKTDF